MMKPIPLPKSEAELLIFLSLACEFGYKQCEDGHNIQAARENFRNLLRATYDDGTVEEI